VIVELSGVGWEVDVGVGTGGVGEAAEVGSGGVGVLVAVDGGEVGVAVGSTTSTVGCLLAASAAADMVGATAVRVAWTRAVMVASSADESSVGMGVGWLRLHATRKNATIRNTWGTRCCMILSF
jgi:hypothetical protein